LGLSEGRLKQDAPAPSSRKRKPAPNFDIELVTLKCSQSPSSKEIFSDSQSDDDLASIYELLCEGNYNRSKDQSGSEDHALVRDDDFNDTAMDALSPTPSTTRKRACNSISPDSSPPQKRLKSNNASYRPYSPGQESADDGRHQKRFKFGLKLFGSPSALLAPEVKLLKMLFSIDPNHSRRAMFLRSPQIAIRSFLQEPPMLRSTSNRHPRTPSNSLLMTSSLTNPTLTSCPSLNKQWNHLSMRIERKLGQTFGPQKPRILTRNLKLHRNVSRGVPVDPSHKLIYKATLSTSLALLQSSSNET
jgi:hypothetical protein